MIPPEIAWIVPVIIPCLIGLLVGVIVKNSFKLLFTIGALLILLVLTGYISLTYQDVFDQAMKFLPTIIPAGSGFFEILPYSTSTFIIGLAVGLWKG
jgi:uncharacterized membrane protein (Fun14 family)